MSGCFGNVDVSSALTALTRGASIISAFLDLDYEELFKGFCSQPICTEKLVSATRLCIPNSISLSFDVSLHNTMISLSHTLILSFPHSQFLSYFTPTPYINLIPHSFSHTPTYHGHFLSVYAKCVVTLLNNIDVLTYLKIAELARKTVDTLYCARNDDQFCGALLIDNVELVSFFNSMYGNRVVSETCMLQSLVQI